MYCGLEFGIADFAAQGTYVTVLVNLALYSLFVIAKQTFEHLINTLLDLLDDLLGLGLTTTHMTIPRD